MKSLCILQIDKYEHASGNMTLERALEIFRDSCPFYMALPFLLADTECESSASVPATVPDSCIASDMKETYSSDTVSKIKPLFCTFSWLWSFITAIEKQLLLILNKLASNVTL